MFFFLSEIADVFNCLTYLAYSSLYNLEISAQIFAAVQNITAPPTKGANVSDLARQVALGVATNHPQSAALLANLPEAVDDKRIAAMLCRIPAFLSMSMKLDDVQQLGSSTPEMDLSVAGAILALFNKRLPLELFAPQMKANKKLDNRSRLLVNCYRYLMNIFVFLQSQPRPQLLVLEDKIDRKLTLHVFLVKKSLNSFLNKSLKSL